MNQKSYNIEIWGRTYPYRNRLKELGLWWDDGTQKWIGLVIERDVMRGILKSVRQYNIFYRVRETSDNMPRYEPLLRKGQQKLEIFS